MTMIMFAVVMVAVHSQRAEERRRAVCLGEQGLQQRPSEGKAEKQPDAH